MILKSRPARAASTRMAPHTVATKTTIVIMLSICATLQHHIPLAEASGVFELEILKIQQNDQANESPRATSTQNKHITNDNDLVRVFVCLKEAFTSQLDGPCTFGNATITVQRDSSTNEFAHEHGQTISTTSFASNFTANNAQQPNNNTILPHQHHQNKAMLSNLVRILFTFRWTVSSV